MSLKDYFPGLSIEFSTIRELIRSGQDIYEKIMGLSMFMLLVSLINPVLVLVYAFYLGSHARMIYVILLIIFFVVSVRFRQALFWLPALIGFNITKLIFFNEAVSDVLFAAAFFAIIYLMFRVKTRTDSEGFTEVSLQDLQGLPPIESQEIQPQEESANEEK